MNHLMITHPSRNGAKIEPLIMMVVLNLQERKWHYIQRLKSVLPAFVHTAMWAMTPTLQHVTLIEQAFKWNLFLR